MTKNNKTITFFIPIRNMGWLYQDYLLNGNLKLRFLDLEIEDDILKKLGLNPIKYRSVVIYKHKYSDDNEGEIFEYIAYIEKIIGFLRLYVNKKIYYERYFRLEDITDKKELFTNLKPSQVKTAIDLKEKWGKFEKVYKHYKLSFDWYKRSLDFEVMPSESLLFLTIALEGILLKGINQELSYRLALRGAYSIGKDKKQRLEYFKLLKKAYSLRSTVVHGSEKQYLEEIKKIGSMYGFRENLTKYTENLLKQIVENPKLLDNIDNLILKGKAGNN